MKLIRNNNWGICPARWFDSLFSEFSDLFDANFGKGIFKDSGYPYNVYSVKDGDKIVEKIEIALAGVERDRISVSVKNDNDIDYLVVAVSSKEAKEDGAVYKKISNKAYTFAWALLDHDIGTATSEFKDGLLTVKVDKKAVKEPVVRQIEVK